VASFEPAQTCEELQAEEAEELCRIYDCMVSVIQDGPRCGEVEIEGYCQTMLQAFFGMNSANSAWRAKEAWDYLLKKPIPLSNGRCVICVVKEYDKNGTPCKIVYTTLCADDDDECPNRYCGWDYVALAKATSEMWSWFYSSGFLEAGNPVSETGEPLVCPMLATAGTKRIEIGSGAAAMWHPLFESLPLEDQAKLDKCGPCYDPTFVPDGWDSQVDEDGSVTFYGSQPVYEWKETYVYVDSVATLKGEDCPPICAGQTIVIDGCTYPAYKKEDGTVAVDLTGTPSPLIQFGPLMQVVGSDPAICIEPIFVVDETGCRVSCKYYIQGTKTEWDGDPDTELEPKQPAVTESPVDEFVKVPTKLNGDFKSEGPLDFPVTFGLQEFQNLASLTEAVADNWQCPGVAFDAETCEWCFPADCETIPDFVALEGPSGDVGFNATSLECEASYSFVANDHNCGPEPDNGPALPGCGDPLTDDGSCGDDNGLANNAHRFMIETTPLPGGNYEICFDFSQTASVNGTSFALYDSAGNYVPTSSATYGANPPILNGINDDGTAVLGGPHPCGDTRNWWGTPTNMPTAYTTQICYTYNTLPADTYTVVLSGIQKTKNGDECVSNLSIKEV